MDTLNTPQNTPIETQAASSAPTAQAQSVSSQSNSPTTESKAAEALPKADGSSDLLGDALKETPQAEEATKPEEKKSEDKPEDKKDEKPEDKKEDVKPSAPEKYEDFKLPEGFELNKEQGEQFKTVAKSLNLTQEQAQKLVDFQTDYAKSHQEQALAQYRQQVEGWKQESIKAFGANYKQELGYAAKAVRQFGGDGLAKLLEQSGMGNRHEVLGFLNKVGKSISEDRPAEGKALSAPKSFAERLYGSSSK